ncbi:DnaB-like helicase C-terminal domain-containing protein [Thermodesulfobacteriota bacterium]
MQHIQAGKDLAGLLLQKPEAIPNIIEIVKPDDLPGKLEKTCLKAIYELYQENEQIDVLSVKTKSGLDGVYLTELLDILPSVDPLYLVKQVKENSITRQAETLIKKYKTAPAILADKLQNLCITQGLKEQRDPSINAVIDRFKTYQQTNNERGSLGIPTGLNFLEKRFIQYVPGHLWIVGGFTSVGKTFLKTEMLCRLLKAGGSRILVISTEMTEEQIVARILANVTGFNPNVIMSGMIHENNKDRLDAAIEWLNEKNLTIYDTVFSLPEITARIKKAEKQAGVDIVFIDYLQNCTVPGAKDIYTEQSRLIKALQQQAKLTRCCIVALSQLSNSAAREENGILEFKGAGEIAATADIGLKLNRYTDNERNMLVTIGKGRHWTRGAQVMQFQNNWTSLQEIEHADNW